MQMEKYVARERQLTNGRQKNQSEHHTFRSPYARISSARCCVAVCPMVYSSDVKFQCNMRCKIV